MLDSIVGGVSTIGKDLGTGEKHLSGEDYLGEHVTVRVTKKKSRLIEAVVTEVHKSSPERVMPTDPSSYLSTSPWQIMTFDAEQHYKAALIEEAFERRTASYCRVPSMYTTDDQTSQYRNKVEFSWFSSGEAGSYETLDLAFFQIVRIEGENYRRQLPALARADDAYRARHP